MNVFIFDRVKLYVFSVLNPMAMMLRLLLLSLLCMLVFNPISAQQNLVPNPSFEEYDTCPTTWNQVSYATDWNGVRKSPDYFNTCSFTNGIYPPNTGFGYQQPHSGNAYVGLSTFDKYDPNYREIISNHLISSLEIGEKYFFSFYVNMGGQYTLGSNKIGVLFSTTPFSISSSPPLNNFAHYYWNDIITDTINWIKLEGSVISDSLYQYMMIGNFFTDENTDTVGIGLQTINTNSYYFLDDVCLSTDSMYCEVWTSVPEKVLNGKNISIYPIPAWKELQIENVPYDCTELQIINTSGQLVQTIRTIEDFKATIDISALPEGIYTVVLKRKNEQNIRRFIKSP